MTSFKKILCCFALIATSLVTPATAWHGHGWRHGYGFGHHHHCLGWGSYSRASFYSSYGYGGLGYSSYSYRSCWPHHSYYVSYGFAPVYYNYYVPTYYAPVYYTPTCYSTYVAPVVYSNFYASLPSSSVTPRSSSLPIATYATKNPLSTAVPVRLASQPRPSVVPAQVSQPPVGRYVLTQTPSPALDTAPEELIAAADAILAAGGYRQAAQAYAQIVVKHGNSDRLVTRRFIAQVANGDYEQAAVVVELAAANGNQINQSDVPQGDLQTAIGDQRGLIDSRSESLAETALQKSDDATPMLTVAHWLALSGDQELADLFKARAEQMQQVEVGKLISTRGPSL
jgi:hypothetical protein